MKGPPSGYLWCLCLFALLVRVLVARWPYSGAKSPPTYGDFEAQSHWMEVTLHLPIGKWYWADPEYWPLDYPPLTAYVSMICGMIAHWVCPKSVAFLSSRGEESPETVALMRGFVIGCDLLTWFTAALIMAWYLQSSVLSFRGHNMKTTGWWWFFAIVGAALFQPAFVLIDHAHHQYNCIVLGLALGAAAAIHRDHDFLGSVLFCMSMNFKQTSIFYAPAFFFVLLGKAFASPEPLRRVIYLGITVITTFVVIWMPFCIWPQPMDGVGGSCIEGVAQLLRRIFPFQRGLYEDKVSNIWYVADEIFKFHVRRKFSLAQLAKGALFSTTILLVPLGIVLPRKFKNRIHVGRQILIAMFTSAMAFFLVSYHVHEKGILFPLAPLSLLWSDWPIFVTWVQIIGSFSMHKLLWFEGTMLPYAVLTFAYPFMCCSLAPMSIRNLWNKSPPGLNPSLKQLLHYLFALSAIAGLLVHCVNAVYASPPRYPDLFNYITILLSTLCFSLSYVVGIYWLWAGIEIVHSEKQK